MYIIQLRSFEENSIGCFVMYNENGSLMKSWQSFYDYRMDGPINRLPKEYRDLARKAPCFFVDRRQVQSHIERDPDYVEFEEGLRIRFGG